VFPIDLPPLRDHIEDVPALANHFALRAATRFGTPPRIPSPEDLELLVAYAWPGNVRELIAVIERAVILGNGARLEVAKALGVAPGAAPAPPRALARAEVDEPFATLDRAVARHIEAALALTRAESRPRRRRRAARRQSAHAARAHAQARAGLAPLPRAVIGASEIRSLERGVDTGR